MKPARFLLACLALLCLAACSHDPVSPASGTTPRFDEQSSDGTGPTTTECTGTWATVTLPDGSVSIECRQAGSGM
jgi:hypothetical protein